MFLYTKYNSIAFLLAITFFVVLSGCNKIKPSSSEQDVNSISHSASDFEMRLFSDKKVYKTSDIIRIWATLEYAGNSDTITVWISDPYMVFSITDGKDFNIHGSVVPLETTFTHIFPPRSIPFGLRFSAVLKRGELYRFDYQKSGGFSADDPNASFWENFYAEEDLLLPAGEYTIILRGEFSLSENIDDGRNELLCELKIKIE